ncbi:MAG: prepilin-type N-terminal cleavage/methylation domain-containing protein [Comamonadaceae bacterium]|nr:MAG: prepilin-type N-terminal cleavage/methylation domain-containing protein [Comamonadaceae bacterium]
MLKPASLQRLRAFRAGQRGFNLIELLVVIAILGILMAAGLPLVTDGIRDSRMRSAGESIISGLRVAQSEALKRNTTVRFQLTSALDSTCAISASGTSWVVSTENATGKCDVTDLETSPMPIRREGGAVSGDVTVLADGSGSFCFNGIGRPTTTPPGCNGTLAEVIDIKSSSITCKAEGGDGRCLRVTVSAAGTIRMCDPAVGDTKDPRIC